MQDSYADKILKRALQDNNDDLDLKVLLEAKMKEYDLTKTKVRNLLNIDADTFEDIISGNSKKPTLINVIKIAQFLEINENDAIAAILKNVDKSFIGSIERAKNASFIAKNFDIKRLEKIGFFENTDNIDYLTKRVLTFFGYNSIYEFETKLNNPLYAKTKKVLFADKMKDFWVKSAYQCFKDINNPFEYDRKALKELIVNIKPYCQDIEDGLFTVCKALYNVGVTVIIQSQLTTTQVMGGTFIVNGKPCIVLTDFNKKYTTLWFVLIHELHHVLYDLDVIATTNFHLTGDPDLFLIEDKANDFAREYFCGADKYNYIKPHINNPFLVKKFAKENEIHESFVYASYRHFQKLNHGKNYYGAFTDFFPDYSIAIKNLNPLTWKDNSLPEIAQKLKTIFELNVIS